MKKVLIIVLICTGMFSCTKDDNNKPAGNESYKPDGVITAEPAVMYTKAGIINDQTLIKRYLTRKDRLATYAFDQQVPAAGLFSSYTLEFSTDKDVLLGDVKAEIISKNDTLLIMAVLNATTEIPKKPGMTDSLADLINKNGALAECPTHYTAPCPYRKKYPLLISAGRYYIPYVVATVSTNVLEPTSFNVPVDKTYSSSFAGQSMLFNEAVTTQLGGTVRIRFNNMDYDLERNDTIVIQQLRQGLIKK